MFVDGSHNVWAPRAMAQLLENAQLGKGTKSDVLLRELH